MKSIKSDLKRGVRRNMEKEIPIAVSVVMTVFNGEKFLQECMDSIVNQSLQEIEIVCVDDGSFDHTPEILKEYEKNDPRIRILTNEVNQNAGYSRNRGLEAAKGKYVIFLDADDIFEKTMLEKSYQKAEKSKADVCIFKEDLFDCETGKISINRYAEAVMNRLGKLDGFSPREICNLLFNLWIGWAWDKLFRREFLLERGLRFQEQRTTNDGFLVNAALASAKRIALQNEILIHQRINIRTSLSRTREKSWECCYLYLRKLKQYLLENNLYNTYQKSFMNLAGSFLRWNYSSLGEDSRKKLHKAMNSFLIEEFGFLKMKREDYFEPLHFDFLEEISKEEQYPEGGCSIRRYQDFTDLYLKKHQKIEELFEEIERNQYCAALWGAGERGKSFLSVYGERGIIEKIFDKDSRKAGTEIAENYRVELFQGNSCQKVDFIIVMNPQYLYEIGDMVKKEKEDIKVFDLESFLFFPLTMEECFLI